jgi:hypothetical protein
MTLNAISTGCNWKSNVAVMRRNLLIITVVMVVILLLPFLLRKNAALLGVQGGKKIVATRSIIPNLGAGTVAVYVGKEKIFSLWEDFCDGPEFIYPFADGRRFFSVFNYDTSVLVFVVDLDSFHTNLTMNWPMKTELRNYLAHGATNVVLNSNVLARMPTDEELQEVRDHLLRASENEIKTALIPHCDLGFWRSYVDRDSLLAALASNRDNYWPTPSAP